MYKYCYIYQGLSSQLSGIMCRLQLVLRQLLFGTEWRKFIPEKLDYQHEIRKTLTSKTPPPVKTETNSSVWSFFLRVLIDLHRQHLHYSFK